MAQFYERMFDHRVAMVFAAVVRAPTTIQVLETENRAILSNVVRWRGLIEWRLVGAGSLDNIRLQFQHDVRICQHSIRCCQGPSAANVHA